MYFFKNILYKRTLKVILDIIFSEIVRLYFKHFLKTCFLLAWKNEILLNGSPESHKNLKTL